MLTIMVGMPNAAVTVMQAVHYRSDSAFASNAVTLSTALSMVTIPVMAWLLL